MWRARNPRELTFDYAAVPSAGQLTALIMITVIWNHSVRRYLLQRYAPTNRLLAWLHCPDNLHLGVRMMLLGVAYLAASVGFAALVRAGWPEWLYLLFLLCFYNGVKFLAFGPRSRILLARARHRERRVSTPRRTS